MENQVDYEAEINLRDLGYYILKRWRVLLLAVAAALIFSGGYKGWQWLNQTRNQVFQEQSSQQYEKELKSYEEMKKNLEYEVNSLSETIKNTEIYNQNSVLMKINPYHTYLSAAELYVKTDYKIMPDKVYQAPDYTTSILKSYALLLSKGRIIDEMSEKFSIGPVYLTELIRIKTDLDSRMISITVTHTDMETCEDMLEYLIDCIYSSQGEIEEQIGIHSISMMQQSTDEKVDEDLASYQKAQLDKMRELMESQMVKEQELEGLKKPEPEHLHMIKSTVKLMVLTSFFVFFAAVFVLALQFITSDRILSAEEFRRRVGIKCFFIMNNKPEKGFGAKVDDFILRKEAGQLVMTTEAVFGMLAADLKILLMGSVEETLLLEEKASLVKLQKAAKVMVADGKVWTGDTVEKVLSCDGVILVERYYDSAYKTVQEEVEGIHNMGKEVLGCVLVK